MEMKNLEKAMDIYAKLVTGEDIKRGGANGSLYDDYYGNAEVYEIVGIMLKKLNLNIYEYKESLFLSAGEGNRIFGYTNEELKKSMGLRYNRELYLCYFIMYEILLCFYSDSASYQFKEYIKIDYDYVITGISRYDFTITYLVSESAACEPVLEALTDSITLATPNEMDRKVSGTVSAGGEGLNVRNGPSPPYNICGFVSDGSRVEILQRMVGDDGVLWGRTRKGWICMSYVIVDGEDSTIEKDPPSEKEPDDPYALRDIDDDRITIEGDKKTYRDPGLVLSFPVEWKGLTQSGGDGSSLFFRESEVDTTAGLSVYITLSDYARDWTEAEYLERFSYSDMNDVKIESFTKETLSGYGCTKLVVSYVYMGTEYVQTYYTHIVTGARMYEFTVTCLASEKQELEPVFASIIDSIVLSPL